MYFRLERAAALAVVEEVVASADSFAAVAEEWVDDPRTRAEMTRVVGAGVVAAREVLGRG